MIYKSQYVNIVVRVAFIATTCILLGLVIPLMRSEYLFTMLGITAIILIQVHYLIIYLNKTNRDLTLFFQNIDNKDSSIFFPEKNLFEKEPNLRASLNKIKDLIFSIRSNSEKQNIYLDNLIDQLSVGVIAFKNGGKVEYFNKAASQLLGISELVDLGGLDQLKPGFAKEISLIEPGRSVLYSLALPDPQIPNSQKALKISMQISILKSEEGIQRIVTLQDIVPELERNELDSWHKLIKVLTHEIMNSISPIISLSSGLSKNFNFPYGNTKNKKVEIPYAQIDKTLESLRTITETSKGLIEFVNNYRSLTQLPQPKIELVSAATIINDTLSLIKEEGAYQGITIEIDIQPQDLKLYGDPAQLAQVLLNLIKNSSEALEGFNTKKIKIQSYADHKKWTVFKVIDNGKGIAREELEHIFVPFYSTKQNGSGIGLSLSRQIIRMHGGQLIAYSTPGKETTFIIKI